jgi:hypothetical protein
MADSARVIVEVAAGLVPGQQEEEFTKRWMISSDDWHALDDAPADQSALLAEVNGRATGYAGLLMLQPDKFNWVRTDWRWV